MLFYVTIFVTAYIFFPYCANAIGKSH